MTDPRQKRDHGVFLLVVGVLLVLLGGGCAGLGALLSSDSDERYANRIAALMRFR